MSKEYIKNNYSTILSHENIIEKRLAGDFTQDELIIENQNNLQMCKKYSLNYILIDTKYKLDIEL